MLKDLILKNKGATINKNGKIVQLKTGFQVSKQDVGRVAVGDFTEKMVQDLIAHGLKRGEYAGFWLDDGFVYADISVRIATKRDALKMGKELNQIAVWNWRKNENLLCKA